MHRWKLVVVWGECVLLLGTGALSAHAKAGSGAAEIVSLEGSGDFRESDAQSWKPAAVKQDLHTGNFVRTAEYSRMGLLFRDRTQIRLREKSILQVKEVTDPGRGVDRTVLRLNAGRAWTQSKTVFRGLSVETPSATAAIRGTDWELAVDQDGSSTLTVLSGEVEFYNDLGKLTVRKNEQARAEIGKAPVKLVVVNPRDRVQWVTAYPVEALRHIALHSSRLDVLQRDLDAVKGDGPDRKAERGAILSDLGRWPEAEEEFKAALSQEPGNGRALLGTAFTMLRRGKVAEAEDFLRRAERAGKQADAELIALGRSAALIRKQNFGQAVDLIDRLVRGQDLRQPAAYLIQSDIMIYSGEIARAERSVQSGLQRFPDSAQLYSQMARIYLLTDRTDMARQQAEQALAKDSRSYDARIVLGDQARLNGDAAAAIRHFTEAVTMKPDDDRGWYGLGVVHTEKEDVRPGRKTLLRALEINPAGTGYEGQRGTLESFASNFSAAEKSYSASLDANPDDSVALTGLGIMELKRGNTQAALDAFLRAEVIEPRYARVHLYKAVAYYQLGYAQQALDELRRASELDVNDPMPHFMASIIHTDQYEPGEAVEEAREALRLMPYLKSLNQLASDQKGSTNLGRSFAYFGMEEWAQSYAQESYYPFWAGSHLFLADRYSGFFTKNSELFQGYIADPTVFGTSNRFQTLLPRSGDYLLGGYRYGRSHEQEVTQPVVQVNGMWNSSFPFAYFVNYEPSAINAEPADSIDWKSLTAAVGMKPSHALGLFVFGSDTDIDQTFATVAGGMLFDLIDALDARRADLGAHYTFSPTSQLWLKGGIFKSTDDIRGTIEATPITAAVDVKQQEYALRQTFDAGGGHEVTWGGETAERQTDTSFAQEVIPGAFIDSAYDFTDRSWDIYLSDRYRIGKPLLLQADLAYQHHLRRAAYPDYFLIPPAPPDLGALSADQFNLAEIKPRAGFVYSFGNARLIRAAYQDWVRPAVFSSLGPVATAGIPLDDRLVTSGGTLKRTRGQVEWEWTPKTFTSLFVDHKSVDNEPFLNTPFALTEIEDLFKLQERSFATLASDDLLERTPSFSKGIVNAAGAGLNQEISSRWSVFARYVHTRSRNTNILYEGNDIPYLPRHAGALGVTWVSTSHLFFITRFIYRTERFTDEANTDRVQKSWDGGLDLFWESKRKRILARVGVDQMLDKNGPTFYSAEINFKY